MSERKSICIMALSYIARDGRVLRQIEYLSQHYALTVIGHGDPHPAWANNGHIQWVRLPDKVGFKDIFNSLTQGKIALFFYQIRELLKRAIFPITVQLGRIHPQFYAWGYGLRWRFTHELQDAVSHPHDAFHANDWDTLLPMQRAAQKHSAPLVIDLHEYAPLQWDHKQSWGHKQSMINFMLQRYATKAQAVSTVAPSLATKYSEEFEFAPIVVMNAPELVTLRSHELDPDNIKLIHHGVASPVRKPEVMIEAIALSEPRYSLHLMLLASDYVDTLKELATERAPGRVFFHDAVPPEKIVDQISQFDVGFNIIAPTTFNYLHSLPNKFLEGIVAGLAVCTGPSPSMAAVVNEYKVGCITPTFEPKDIARALNQTTAAQWNEMRKASRDAAKKLNAAQEMSKVLTIYETLFSSTQNSGEHQLSGNNQSSGKEGTAK